MSDSLLRALSNSKTPLLDARSIDMGSHQACADNATLVFAIDCINLKDGLILAYRIRLHDGKLCMGRRLERP